MWHRKGTPNTLTVAGDDLGVSDMGSTEINEIIQFAIDDGSQINILWDFDNNASTVWSYRRSINGGAESTVVSSGHFAVGVDDDNQFTVATFVNVEGDEKLMISQTCIGFTAGEANSPLRREQTAKFTTTVGLVSDFDCDNSLGGSYDTGSDTTILGTG